MIFLVRKRTLLVLIVLGASLLVVLNLPGTVSVFLRGIFRDSVAAYQAGVTRAAAKFRHTSSAVGGGTELTLERNRLKQEVAEAQSQLRLAAALARENADLRRLLEFRERQPFKTVACGVIARDDGYGWWQTIRLDKGHTAGILENMAVITPDGLVGRTIEVSEDTSDVLLISDRNFKVSVQFEEVGSFGVMCGGGVDLRGSHELGVLCAPASPLVDYIRKDVQIRNGGMVVTSGLGGVFPRGLAVGRVRRIFMDESGLFQRVELVPSSDLSRLDKVLVVVRWKS